VTARGCVFVAMVSSLPANSFRVTRQLLLNGKKTSVPWKRNVLAKQVSSLRSNNRDFEALQPPRSEADVSSSDVGRVCWRKVRQRHFYLIKLKNHGFPCLLASSSVFRSSSVTSFRATRMRVVLNS